MNKKIVFFVVALCCSAAFLSLGSVVGDPNGIDGVTVYFFKSTVNVHDDGTAFVSNVDGLKPWEGGLSDALIEKYDENFFESNQLLLIKFTATSGSYRYKLTEFSHNSDGIHVTLYQYVPGVKPGERCYVTADMAYWLAVIESETKYPTDTNVFVNGKLYVAIPAESLSQAD